MQEFIILESETLGYTVFYQLANSRGYYKFQVEIGAATN